jgi:hypothetical protein
VKVDWTGLREELDSNVVRVVATRPLDERRKALYARSKSDRNYQKKASALGLESPAISAFTPCIRAESK